MAGKGKKGKELKKVSKGREEVRAANKPEYVTGTGQELWRVHPATACNGRICDIHNPPQGLPESDWPTHWRSDRALMERICPHGIGHPSKAHMAYLAERDVQNDTDNARWEGIHGCDGCCGILPPKDSYMGETCHNCGDNHDCSYCAPEDYELPEEFDPYFNGASDWERGTNWDEIVHLLMGRTSDPEWVDQDATPNGIGPVCKDCHRLIDWHPVDHALDCPWL